MIPSGKLIKFHYPNSVKNLFIIGIRWLMMLKSLPMTSVGKCCFAMRAVSIWSGLEHSKHDGIFISAGRFLSVIRRKPIIYFKGCSIWISIFCMIIICTISTCHQRKLSFHFLNALQKRPDFTISI